MGFFDKFNPFKKKDDFGFSEPQGYAQQQFQSPQFGDHPMDPHGMDHGFTNPQGLEPNPQFGSTSQFGSPSPVNPLDDHRMNLPLGENIRTQRVNALYGDGQREQHEYREENPLKKDLELISSKLDYLKASLEAINQRLVNLEHYSRLEMERKRQ